jgi:hypothetical protein
LELDVAANLHGRVPKVSFYTPCGVTLIGTTMASVPCRIALFLYALWRDVDWNTASSSHALRAWRFYTPCGVTLIGTVVVATVMVAIATMSFYTPCGVTLIGTSEDRARAHYFMVSIRLVA